MPWQFSARVSLRGAAASTTDHYCSEAAPTPKPAPELVLSPDSIYRKAYSGIAVGRFGASGRALPGLEMRQEF